MTVAADHLTRPADLASVVFEGRLGPFRALEHSEMSECVQGYLAPSDDDRIAILLHDRHDLGNREIAQRLDCSLATAEIRVHRARARLRGTLDAACSFEIDERGVLVCDPHPVTLITDTDSDRAPEDGPSESDVR